MKNTKEQAGKHTGNTWEYMGSTEKLMEQVGKHTGIHEKLMNMWGTHGTKWGTWKHTGIHRKHIGTYRD